MKNTEIEKKYNLNCHIHCPYFPQNVSNSDTINWKYDKNKNKIRINSINYICGYDGHVIKNWTGECPYIKDHKES